MAGRRRLRIATYNVEWFDALFDDDGHLTPTNAWSGRRDVTRADQIAALTTVFRALDADAVLVVEAPDISRRRNGAVGWPISRRPPGYRAGEVRIRLLPTEHPA